MRTNWVAGYGPSILAPRVRRFDFLTVASAVLVACVGLRPERRTYAAALASLAPDREVGPTTAPPGPPASPSPASSPSPAAEAASPVASAAMTAVPASVA